MIDHSLTHPSSEPAVEFGRANAGIIFAVRCGRYDVGGVADPIVTPPSVRSRANA